MSQALELDAIHRALLRCPGHGDIARDELRPMRVKGLAHDHISIVGRARLLRVPRQSQLALSAAANLAYQAACFARVGASGHAPRLYGVLPVTPEVPMGALVVEQIEGRPPRLPDDLDALARAMARVHSLPLPPARERPPLQDHHDPVGGALREIERQAELLDHAELAAAARKQIDDELLWARSFGALAKGRAQPVALVLTDTHPGNFLIDAAGRAVIVDLEKALYGSPAIDLAHATVYSSTTWDPDTHAELSVEEVAAFYARYLEIAKPELAHALRPWLIPLRRILFLRAITWCAKWRVQMQSARIGDKHAASSTEDWSAQNREPALIAHVAGRVDAYLAPETLERMRAEWLGPVQLGGLLGIS